MDEVVHIFNIWNSLILWTLNYGTKPYDYSYFFFNFSKSYS